MTLHPILGRSGAAPSFCHRPMTAWRHALAWVVLLTACDAPRCGDGVLEPTESCEGASAASCATACGTRGTRSCERCAWSECLPPSETCDASDDDCDGNIDEGLGCTLGADEVCTTACGSTGRRHCEAGCAWSACEPPAEICGNGTDDDCDGVVDGPLPPSARPLWDVGRSPAFTARWDGDDMVVVWRREDERGAREIVVTRVGPDGEPGPPAATGLVVASNEGPGWLRAASGDGPLAIGWVRIRDAFIAIARADGSLGGPATGSVLELARAEVGSTTSVPALAWSEGTLHAGYESRSGGLGAIVVKRFGLDGTPGPTTTVTPYEPVIGEVDLAAAPDGVGVVWSAGRTVGFGYVWELSFAFVRANEPPVPVALTEASTVSNHAPSLLADGDGFALAWVRGEDDRRDIVFVRLDATGARVDCVGSSARPCRPRAEPAPLRDRRRSSPAAVGAERRVASGRRGASLPRLRRSGDELAATWLEVTDTHRRAFFRRLGRDGRPRGAIVPLGETASSPEALWDGSAHLVLTTSGADSSMLVLHRIACE